MRPRIGAECALAAAAALALYARTLAPGVGAGDGGELLLAASTLGVPHPPGYPLWTLFAGAAAALPFGALALRVNALSAIFAAVGVALLWALGRRAGLGRFGAAVATALFASSIPVWRTAVEAEVYSLAAAAFLALVLLAGRARSRRTAGARADALFFVAAGLAFLAHQTLAAPALVLGGWVLARSFTWARGAAAAAWTLLGLTPALYAPIRVAAPTAFAWKERAPLEALADVFSRGAYGAVAQNPLRLDLLAESLAGMAGAVLSGAGPVAAVLAAAFLAAGLLRRRGLLPRLRLVRATRALRVPAIAALSIPAGLAAIVRFTPDAERLAQVEPFLIPVAAILALAAGAGAVAIVRALRAAASPGRPLRRVAARAAAAAVALAVAATLAAHFPYGDRSGFRLPERYGRDLLASVPRGATLVVDGDNETFLAAYLVRGEGVRSDLTIRHRRGVAFGDAYGLASLPRAGWTVRARAAELDALDAGAALWFATPPRDLERAGVGFAARGLAARALPPGAPPAAPWRPDAAWPRSNALLGDRPERYDFVTRKLAVAYSDAAARAAWSRGDAAEALAWYEDASRVAYDMPEAHWNVAVAAAAVGNPDRALDALLAARARAPHRAEGAARLAAFLAAAGRYQDAARWFERAFRDEPSPALASDVSRAWSLAGDAGRAALWRERAEQGGRAS